MKKSVSIMLAALMLGGAPLAQAADLPEWLTGEWQQERGDRWTEELWSLPRGGVMIGMGRSGRGESLQSWEVMRIVRAADGTLTLHAAPEGGKEREHQLWARGPQARFNRQEPPPGNQ